MAFGVLQSQQPAQQQRCRGERQRRGATAAGVINTEVEAAAQPRLMPSAPSVVDTNGDGVPPAVHCWVASTCSRSSHQLTPTNSTYAASSGCSVAAAAVRQATCMPFLRHRIAGVIFLLFSQLPHPGSIARTQGDSNLEARGSAPRGRGNKRDGPNVPFVAQCCQMPVPCLTCLSVVSG